MIGSYEISKFTCVGCAVKIECNLLEDILELALDAFSVKVSYSYRNEKYGHDSRRLLPEMTSIAEDREY